MKDIRLISRPDHFIVPLLFLFFSLCFPIVSHSDPQKPSGEQTAQESLILTGYLSTKYVHRSAEASDNRFRDQDLFGELRMDITAPEENTYEAHLFGTLRRDLSDNRDSSAFYPLEDSSDAHRSDTQGYLYEANLAANDLFRSVPRFTLGRQSGTRDEPLFFDGIAADVRATSKLIMTLYGGAAVHFYEIDGHGGDDTLAGAGLDYSFSSNTSASLDYLSVSDQQNYPANADLRDRMASLKVWHSFASLMKGSAKYRYLNGEPRDVSVRAVTAFPESDMQLNVNYFRQFRTQNELSNELSLYYAILGRSAPYQTYDVKLRKLFGPHYAVDLGYLKRELIEASGESLFDRDYNRTFLLIEFIDLVRERLSFSIIAEQWEAGGREYDTAGFDAGYKFKGVKKARVNGGTYYSLYKYDYYAEQGLREKVRTYYVNGNYPLISNFWFNGSYEFEDSIENYQTLRLGMRYDF